MSIFIEDYNTVLEPTGFSVFLKWMHFYEQHLEKGKGHIWQNSTDIYWVLLDIILCKFKWLPFQWFQSLELRHPPEFLQSSLKTSIWGLECQPEYFLPRNKKQSEIRILLLYFYLYTWSNDCFQVICKILVIFNIRVLILLFVALSFSL